MRVTRTPQDHQSPCLRHDRYPTGFSRGAPECYAALATASAAHTNMLVRYRICLAPIRTHQLGCLQRGHAKRHETPSTALRSTRTAQVRAVANVPERSVILKIRGSAQCPPALWLQALSLWRRDSEGRGLERAGLRQLPMPRAARPINFEDHCSSTLSLTFCLE